MTPLSAPQLHLISTITRLASVLSILGSLFIILTFASTPTFRKPVTRLIFYATWGNLITNGATLLSTSAIPHGDGTAASGLCTAQAALMQWFMLADPCWVFCMALNVWMVFSRGCDGRDLRRLEKWYAGFAYGVPGIAAVGYLVHDAVSERRILGPAILWCWVSGEFEWMRIVFYYAPVWVLAGATMSIYVCVGVNMYRQQVELKAFMERSRHGAANGDPFSPSTDGIVVTTEIEHESNLKSRSATPGTEMRSLTPSSSSGKQTVTDAPSNARSSTPSSPAKSASAGRYNLLVPLNPNSPLRHASPLLISYRATAYAAPLASGDFATLPSPRVPIFRPFEHALYQQQRKENAAAHRYFLVAVLLFAALLVVWVPSSINRLYQMAHAQQPSFGLNLVAALVLPLQGLGNAVVYASTTWVECKRAYASLGAWFSGGARRREGEGSVGRDEAVVYNGCVEMKGSFKDRSFLQTV
ncbi:transmembrane signaling receptor [Ascochyta rabiei]|uniref:Transmembrane signaling receptor n=1 Tax=Didymella rabiei TaxID=5454 RepID=A0A162XLI6_DIDRA|nr:transmembrane signaling receptor [Ascochyta rabiei]